jgi:hypothetical protein
MTLLFLPKEANSKMDLLGMGARGGGGQKRVQGWEFRQFFWILQMKYLYVCVCTSCFFVVVCVSLCVKEEREGEGRDKECGYPR